MRPFIAALPKIVLALATLALLGVGLFLRPATSAAAIERRDAFAGEIERGEKTLSTATIAKEWRAEIAAQRMIAERDSILSWGLLAVGLLGLIVLVASSRKTASALPGSG